MGVRLTDAPGKCYELDLTDQALADYAVGRRTPMTSFRLQLDDVSFAQDDQSHGYRLAMKGDIAHWPQLLMSFEPIRLPGDFDGSDIVAGRYCAYRSISARTLHR